MKAIVYHRYGPPDVLQYVETEIPRPSETEVLIKVRAASVNPYDWHFLRGTPAFIRAFTGLTRPKSPLLGADVAGIVEAVGSKVTRFKPGDSLYGTCKGAFAEFACAAENTLSLMPASLTFEQAASIPIAGVTALQGLRDSGHLQPGQRVLINGAAGGVGTFAVQIAKAFGAHVTGVCSTRNLELIRSLGADYAIDYSREDFTRENSIQSNQKFDVLFDLAGNRPLSSMRRVLHPRGIFVGCGGGGPDRGSAGLLASMLGRMMLAPFARQKLAGILAKIQPSDLEALNELVRAGKLTPVLDRTYPLQETPEAIRYVEQGHVRGKVTIAVA